MLNGLMIRLVAVKLVSRIHNHYHATTMSHFNYGNASLHSVDWHNSTGADATWVKKTRIKSLLAVELRSVRYRI